MQKFLERKGVKSFCAKRIKLYYYPIYSSNICTFQLLHIQLFMKNQIYPLFCVKYTYNKFVVTNFDTKNARRRLQSDKGVNMHTYTMNTYIIPNTLS